MKTLIAVALATLAVTSTAHADVTLVTRADAPALADALAADASADGRYVVFETTRTTSPARTRRASAASTCAT